MMMALGALATANQLVIERRIDPCSPEVF